MREYCILQIACALRKTNCDLCDDIISTVLCVIAAEMQNLNEKLRLSIL